jgi:peptidoglycan/LPS O-acetylase OafA/YrhL
LTRPEIKPLTGIRGIAALYVVVYHLNGFGAPASMRIGGLMRPLVDHGYLAVDLFFVLSGYVMALSYGEMVRVWDGRSYVRFLIRRIARVYPLYILITLSAAVLIAIGVSHEPMPDLGIEVFWNALMVQGWGFGHSLDAPAWSVSTEWAAYLLFPLLATATLFGPRHSAVAAAAISCVTVTILAIFPFGSEGPLDIWGPGTAVARCVAEFSLGLISFRLSHHPRVRAWASHPASAGSLTAAIVLLLMIPRSDLAVAALLPPFILTLGVGRGPVQAVLASRPAVLAGELSYAIYLMHARFVRFRDVLEARLAPLLGSLAPVITVVVVYAALLLTAWLAYRYIEKPARGWVRHAEVLLTPLWVGN